MEWEVKECPETFAERAEMAAVQPIEVDHVDEVLWSVREVRYTRYKMAYNDDYCADNGQDQSWSQAIFLLSDLSMSAGF